jgi:hypothetical protein
MLETAKADALHLKDPEGFGGCLEDLRAAVNDLAAYSRDGLMLDRDPALVDEAATLLRGGKLGVGAATEISARAREYVKLLAAWRKDAARARRYDHWAQALEEKLASEGHDPSAEDLTALFEARVKIAEAQNELLYAEDALDLERSGVIGDLKQAYETLARLGASVAVWESVGEEPRADSRRSARRRVQREGIAEENSHESSGPIGRFPADGGGRAAEPLLLARGRRPVEMGRWFRLAPTLLGLALALLIAVSALLVAGLYPETNEPFGTTRDYIAAFAAGATGPAAAQFLQGPLTSFLARARS